MNDRGSTMTETTTGHVDDARGAGTASRQTSRLIETDVLGPTSVLMSTALRNDADLLSDTTRSARGAVTFAR